MKKVLFRAIFIAGCVSLTIAVIWLLSNNEERAATDTAAPQPRVPDEINAPKVVWTERTYPHRVVEVPGYPVASAARSNEPVPRIVRVAAESGKQDRRVGVDAITNEWILTFRDGNALNKFINADGQRRRWIVDVIPGLNAIRIRGLSEEQIRSLAGRDSDFSDPAPNFFVRLPPLPEKAPGLVPDQKYTGFGLQALEWLGIKGNHSKWGAGLTIAVLDVGVEACPSLTEGNITRIDLTEEGSSAATAPKNPHATAVAAILAGNMAGKEGISPALDIMSIKVLNDAGVGDSFTLAKGIMEAVQRGAPVINLSLGSRGDSAVVRQAVDYAIQRGTVIVAAAGNEGTDGVSYPAKYDGVVAVTAVDAAGNRLDFANRGVEVDLAAPGLGVLAQYSTGKAFNFSGTSAAVPFVAGAIAGLMSQEPGLRAGEAVDILYRYSDDAGAPGKDPEYGCGILDMQRVLNRKTRGIYDVALAGNYLSGEGAEKGQIHLLVSAQNCGTERLSGADLNVRIGDSESTMILPAMDVGETVARQLTIRADQVNASSGITVSSRVSLRDATDSNPQNNSRATAFTASVSPVR